MKVIERIDAACLMAAMICAIIASISCTSAATGDYSDLMKLITDREDVRIDARDLAFLLATHGFDAAPKDGYVIVRLDEVVYKMTPNDVKPGLADTLIIDQKAAATDTPHVPEL